MSAAKETPSDSLHGKAGSPTSYAHPDMTVQLNQKSIHKLGLETIGFNVKIEFRKVWLSLDLQRNKNKFLCEMVLSSGQLTYKRLVM